MGTQIKISFFAVLFVCAVALIFMVHRENQVESPIKDMVILPSDEIDYDLLTPATTFEFADIISPLPLVSITTSYDLIFIGTDGREARVNFENEVAYSGDLPVAESAKLLFKAFNEICHIERLK